MRYLVISDIHANLDALDAVLAAAADARYERVLVLGDLVGYGAQPNEVIERVRSLEPFAIIRGNHDKVAAGLEESEGFNPIAQEAASWTYATLTPENRAYLAACPIGPILVDPEIEICHGSPADEDVYITSDLAALRALHQSERPVCFYGHTHIPVAFKMTETEFEIIGRPEDSQDDIVLEGGARYLINPGSVGQPRDGDPRAAFAVLDTDSHVVSRYRTGYAVELAQQRILESGLPATLARRLALGR